MNNSTVRIASAQYRIEKFGSWDALEGHISRWVEEAAQNRAKLMMFPEYASMEMAGLPDSRRAQRRSPERHFLGPLPVRPLERRQALSLFWASDVVQPLILRYLTIFATLAAKHRTYILPGSLPFRHPDGSFTNRAFLFAPDGRAAWQDKMVLSRWERDFWKMRGGAEVRVFESEYGRIGVNICYDVEFPVVARRQAEAGACIILAPCCCDSLRGYYRVRVGARARALENQMYVVQSPAIGNANWLAEFDRLVGFAGIYGPPDLGPRENGVVAQGAREQAEWIYGDVDLAAIDRIRGGAGIANVSEWGAHMVIGDAVPGNFINVRQASEALSLVPEQEAS
ncbi:MAG TPA: carbon-nitrogen hydrolase family protein [Sphingomicrobium sp.]|jgi:predicted amidohydrolase|nr:carbon-nitrogen hydrolase family protein [Sphingomicrobium sp.]